MNRKSSISQTNPVETYSINPNGKKGEHSFRKKISVYCRCSTCLITVSDCGVTDFVSSNWRRFLKPFLFICTFTVIAVILLIFLRPKHDTVCFIRVGCFSTSDPWDERPITFNFFPQSPSIINTTFIVTSSKDPAGKHGKLKWSEFAHFGVIDETRIPWSNSSLLIFLIHGYTDDSGTWMQELKDTFLHQADNLIVILVDWHSGASGYYPQVVANTRVVAREISLFIKYIQRTFGKTSPKRVHLVGHSLGSQISSYVGKSLVNSSNEIFQITALDPAYPLFEGYCRGIRLHKSDAQHVLAIHSNIGPWGLGMKDPVGTVDIYLNNGQDQRGCPSIFKDGSGNTKVEEVESPIMKVENASLPKVLGLFSNLKDVLACSHRRAYDWLIDILRDLVGAESSHPIRNASTVGYRLKRKNGTDIAKLAKDREIEYTLCTQNNEKGCWKLEKNEEDAFFRLPAAQSNESLSFFIPTTNKSAFCARFALLEIFTCPTTISPSPLFGWLFRERKEPVRPTTLTISQTVCAEEVQVYKGQLKSDKKIRAWVEFSCDVLQAPIHLHHDNQSSSSRNESNLSVKLTLSIEVPQDEQRKSNSTKNVRSSSTTAPGGPSLCVSNMKLTYFNETDLQIKRINWNTNDGYADDKFVKISQNECVEVSFAAMQNV